MPPQRGPISTKGLKTERTHEENQERAYIAASRRSDRSLEARIESARRASEIHKKRTGRSLRVTEQDVINEEMYEEEDDDLQSQYRRLQAHLGNSADLFNGRLNSWILSQFGTRQLAAAAQGPMGFHPGMQTAQTMTPFFAYNPPASPVTTLSPQMTQRGQYRQSPYPPQRHSIGSIDHMKHAMTAGTTDNQRSHSVGGGISGSPTSATPQTDGSSQMQPPMARADSMAQAGSDEFFTHPQMQTTSMASPKSYVGYPATSNGCDTLNQLSSSISPLTTALPMETQQLIGSSFEPNSPWTSYFMTQANTMNFPQGLQYSYNPNLSSMKHPINSEGINQTLSPNPLMSPPAKIDNTCSLADTSGTQAFDCGFGLGFTLSQSDVGTNPLGTPNAVDSSTYFNDWIDSSHHEETAV